MAKKKKKATAVQRAATRRKAEANPKPAANTPRFSGAAPRTGIQGPPKRANIQGAAARAVTQGVSGSGEPTAAKSAYPTSNVSANSSGNIQLQTNAEIEMGVLDAREQYRQAEEQAIRNEQLAEVERLRDKEALRVNNLSENAAVNAREAFTGMHGTSALRRSAQNRTNQLMAHNQIGQNYNLAKQASSDMRTAGKNALRNANAGAIMQRQDYTNQRSAEFPTAGSSPVNSGLRATTVMPEYLNDSSTVNMLGSSKPKAKKLAVKNAAKRKAK